MSTPLTLGYLPAARPAPMVSKNIIELGFSTISEKSLMFDKAPYAGAPVRDEKRQKVDGNQITMN